MGFVFSGVLVVYNLDRLVGSRDADQINTTKRASFFQENSTVIYFLIGLGLTSSGLFLILTSFVYIMAAIGLCSITLLYLFLQYIAQGRAYISHVFSLLKPFVLAIVWLVLTLLLPITEIGGELRPSQFMIRFIALAQNSLWFDYRDIEGDSVKLKPNFFTVIGPKLFSTLNVIALLLAIVIASMHSFQYWYELLPCVFMAAISFSVFRMTKQILYDIMIDGSLALTFLGFLMKNYLTSLV